MKNPYSILGVPPDADARRLRGAHQALLRLHHGDAKRTREVNDAYDAILLSLGGSDEAVALLECVPEGERGSEWHYRMGCVQRERGWLEEAEARFAHAALFAPENLKYRMALKRARTGRSGESVESTKSGKGGFWDGIGDGCAQGCFECCCEIICC